MSGRRELFQVVSANNLIAGVVLLAGVLVFSCLILDEKLFYLVGLMMAGLFGFAVLAGELELGIVICLAAALIVEIILRGYWTFHELSVGASDMILVVLWILYLVWVRTERKQREVDSAEVLWIIFAICLFASALSAEYLKGERAYGYPGFIYIGVRGLAIFALTRRILARATPDRLRLFVVAMVVVGLFISINENGNILFGKSLLHIRGIPDNFWVNATRGVTKLERAGFITRSFTPFAADTRVAIHVAVPFLALALSMFTSRTESIKSKIFYGLALGSIACNMMAYMSQQRIALLAILTVGGSLIFKPRGWRLIVFAGLGLSIVFGLMVSSSVLGINPQAHNLWWLARNLLESPRWITWCDIFKSLFHFPLLFGTGLLNLHAYMEILRRFSGNLVPILPHNAYIQVLLGAGLPAFLVFIILLGIVLRKAFTALTLGGKGISREVLVGLFGASLTLCVLAVFKREILWREVNFLFSMVLGGTLGLAQNVVALNRAVDADWRPGGNGQNCRQGKDGRAPLIETQQREWFGRPDGN